MFFDGHVHTGVELLSCRHLYAVRSNAMQLIKLVLLVYSLTSNELIALYPSQCLVFSIFSFSLLVAVL